VHRRNNGALEQSTTRRALGLDRLKLATQREQLRTRRRRFIAGTQRCSSPPRSQDARGRHIESTRGEDVRHSDHTYTPLVRASALHGVSGHQKTLGARSHLGSTLNPGGAVLTRGVFRRSGSVAFIRADASPSEVLAPISVDLQTTTRQDEPDDARVDPSSLTPSALPTSSDRRSPVQYRRPWPVLVRVRQ
jgi:hypothetical protein